MIKKLKDYGLIKGKIHNFESQWVKINPIGENKEFIPHYTFALNCNNQIYHANINVYSINPLAPNLNVYYCLDPEEELNNPIKFIKSKELNHGIYRNLDICMSIDYIRDQMFDMKKLQKIVDDKNIEKNILLTIFDQQIRIANANNYDICIWGQLYDNVLETGNHKFGIHDIHMNQGNFNAIDNGVYSDGCLIIIDPIKNKVVFSIFIKFDGQCTKTYDENGDCLVN